MTKSSAVSSWAPTLCRPAITMPGTAPRKKVRTLIIDDFKKAFEKVDVLVGPTSPVTAFKFGEKTEDPMAMYAIDITTIPANLAGVPAMSIPGRPE